MKPFLLTLAVLVLLSQITPGNLDLLTGGIGGGEWVSVSGHSRAWENGMAGGNVQYHSFGEEDRAPKPCSTIY